MAWAGTVLAILQSVGFIISLYLLVSNYNSSSSDLYQDDPHGHVCVEAVLCLMFRYGPALDDTGQTNTALAGQMVYSLLAITVNCMLVCGALANKPGAMLPWLIVYGLNCLGSIILSIIISLTILYRDSFYGDIHIVNVLWFILPLTIFVLYTILWCYIFSVYRKFKSYKNDIYYVKT